MPLSFPILIPVTNEPVYMRNEPNRCLLLLPLSKLKDVAGRHKIQIIIIKINTKYNVFLLFSMERKSKRISALSLSVLFTL